MTTPDRERGGNRLVIGRVGGIPIRLHPAFFVLVALAVAGALGPPLEGLLWLALLFGSVVVHELSHSLVARARGVVVKDIVLLPIGGVSEMERLPERPRDELAVAVAGPAASVALALAVGLVATVAGVDVLPPALTAGHLLRRLAWANVLLAGFNLLPAFPLDGGRVLRAALAQRIGLEAATRQAAAVGRRLAAAMAVLGLLFDAWLLLIAVFVWFGSRAEESATVVHVRLQGLRVADVMVPVYGFDADVPLAVSPDTPAEEVLRKMLESSASIAAVVDDAGKVLGLVVMDDLARLVNGPAR